EVRKGHEVTIKDRGKAVARLVPPRPADAKPFRGRAAFRRRMSQLTTPLSSAILDGRAERSLSKRAGFPGHRDRGVHRRQRVGEALCCIGKRNACCSPRTRWLCAHTMPCTLRWRTRGEQLTS